MSETAELQLDRAEFTEQHVTTCGACATALATEYYDANGVIVSATCCDDMRAIGTAGSSATWAIRTAGAGPAAALAGSILYYAILALSGYVSGSPQQHRCSYRESAH